MEFVCVSESFPSLFLLQLEVQWLNPRSVNLLLNCYWSWWKLYKKQRSLFTSSFHLIFFIVWYVSVEVVFVSRRRKKRQYFWSIYGRRRRSRRSVAGWICRESFFFCQITFSCTDLNLCWRCLWYRDASLVADLAVLLCCGILLLPKIQRRYEESSISTWRTLFKGLLLVRLGDLNDFIAMKMMNIAAWKGKKSKKTFKRWL